MNAEKGKHILGAKSRYFMPAENHGTHPSGHTVEVRPHRKMAEGPLGVKLYDQPPLLVAVIVFAGDDRGARGKIPAKARFIADLLHDVVRLRHFALAQNDIDVVKLAQ